MARSSRGVRGRLECMESVPFLVWTNWRSVVEVLHAKRSPGSLPSHQTPRLLNFDLARQNESESRDSVSMLSDPSDLLVLPGEKMVEEQ